MPLIAPVRTYVWQLRGYRFYIEDLDALMDRMRSMTDGDAKRQSFTVTFQGESPRAVTSLSDLESSHLRAVSLRASGDNWSLTFNLGLKGKRWRASVASDGPAVHMRHIDPVLERCRITYPRWHVLRLADQDRCIYVPQTRAGRRTSRRKSAVVALGIAATIAMGIPGYIALF